MEAAMESRPSAESGSLAMQKYLRTGCFVLYLSGVCPLPLWSFLGV